MVFDLPFYHQNAHVNITFLVVDDDPISLSMIHNMLITQTYKDKSYGEIKVLTAKNSSEAVSTLRGQCNNIDVVIIDYHIPGLNGIQLKKKIDEEFRNLPVVVISADHSKQIEQKVLASGAKLFLRKPISPDDLNTMWKYSRRSHMSDPGNINANRLNENAMERSSNALDGKSSRKVTKNKKPQLKWTSILRNKFLQSINHIGVTKAKPMGILKYMEKEGLTRDQIASYLQKYRISLKSVKEQGDELQKAAKLKNSSFEPSSDINSQDSYNNNPVSCNNADLISQLMRNNNYSIPNMNKLPIYDSSRTSSHFLPAEGRLGFSNGMLPPMKGRLGYSSGTFGTSQAPQVPRFGQYCTTNGALGMNSNLNTGYMTNNYAGIRLNGNGDLLAPGGGRVNVNGNGSLGGNLDAMNWTNYNNINMSNNHGNSNPMFPSAFPSFLDNEYHQSENNLAAQVDGVVPVLENPNIYNGPHHGINEVFHGTVNSQYDQNQREGNVNGENFELPNYDVLERNEIFYGTVNSHYDQNKSQGNNVTGKNLELPNYDVLERNEFFHGTVNSQYFQNQRQGNNVTGENLELPNNDLFDERNGILDPYPFEDISDRGFDNDLDYNIVEKLLNAKIAANSGTYVPAGDMNNMDQEQEAAEIEGLLSTFGPDWEARGVL